jgi:hypothetical protein
MVQYDYAIAAGWDQTSLTNVETLTYAPVGKPVPLGSVRRITLDQRIQSNGTKVITWSFAAMSWANFEALVAFIWGDFFTENANVTIATRERNEQFSRFNAVAHLPVEGTDYQRRAHGDVEALTITLRDLQPLTGGNEFDYSFSLDFTS